jgi:hypothetical protein
MNLPIVDFQTAKDIKELGFDWKVNRAYLWDNGKYFLPQGELNIYFKDQNHNLKPHRFSAPTQVEVCKWLRDEKNISVIVEWYGAPGQIEFEYEVCFFVDVSIMEVGYHYNTYEQAELAGIKKAIEILKNK